MPCHRCGNGLGEETYTNGGQAVYCSLACLQAQPEDMPAKADQGLVLWPSPDAWAQVGNHLKTDRKAILAHVLGVIFAYIIHPMNLIFLFSIAILVSAYYHEFAKTD